MKDTKTLFGTRIALLCLMIAIAGTTMAGSLQLVSVRDPALSAPAGGNDDSMSAILSPDGRYVLFASAADNLVLLNGTNAMPIPFQALLNVYFRDRSNATTALISMNLAGTRGGNGDSLPAAISQNGRFALFESSASDLVANDTNNASDVFVRDLQTGLTLLVSAATNGAVGGSESRSAVMTPDGRYVAFVSEAFDLVPDDTNEIADVFVRDLQTGQTRLISVGATGSWLLGDVSESPIITPDGRFVAFYSSATNLIAGAVPSNPTSTRGEIYLRDLIEGTTAWVSTGALQPLQSLTNATSAVSFNHALSEDGQYVAYQAAPVPQMGPGIILRFNVKMGTTDLVYSNAVAPGGYAQDFRNLAITPDGRLVAFVTDVSQPEAPATCIRVWDASTGTSVLASGDINDEVPEGSTADAPAFDASGNYVAFVSDAPGLVTNILEGEYHVYLRNLSAGTTTLVDADPAGVGAGVLPITMPQISLDAKTVAFEAPDGSLVPGDRNHNYDVFVRELEKSQAELVSVRDPAAVGITPNGWSEFSNLSVSGNGRTVAFSSDADDIVANDSNGYEDIFLRDLVNGTNFMVSVALNGAPADGASSEPSISADGRYVAFRSFAGNLVPGDTNNFSDVFVRDRVAGTTTLASVTPDGLSSGNGESYSPILSSDGKYLLFLSTAPDLAPVTGWRRERLLLRNLQAGVTYMLAPEGARLASMTPDGRFVAFSETRFAQTYLSIWDSEKAAKVYTNNVLGLENFFISPDGNRLLFQAGSGTSSLFVADLAANTNWIAVFGVVPGALTEARFSRSGELAGYTWRTNTARQVYLYDFQARTNWLISKAYASSEPGNAGSDSVDISPDGRFVAFRSSASNLVPGDTNDVPDVFLYDTLTGSTTLMSASRFGDWPANNRSLRPVFTADGQLVLFQSWASDLVAGDYNRRDDIFGFQVYSSSAIPVFEAAFEPAADPAQVAWITWPAVPGKTYRVQFKNSLSDPQWLDLDGTASVVGDRVRIKDLAPVAGQKFYRIVAF